MSGPEVAVIGGVMFDYHYAVSNLPQRDGGAFAPSVEVALGGVGGNVAVALNRLGRDVGLVSRIGSDTDGERIRARLQETSIELSQLEVGDDASTYSMIFRDPGGERMIVTANRGYAGLVLERDTIEYLESAGVVFVTAYTPDRVVSELVERARDPAFPPIAFDLSGPLPELVDRGTVPETIDQALETCDLFVSGRVAAKSFVDGPLEKAVEQLSNPDIERAALTRGTDGASLFSHGDRTEIEAFDVPTIDTTGAGDAFVAGLIDQWLLADAAPEEAGRFAAAAAALNCQDDFAQPGLPDRGQVRSFLEAR